MIGLFCLYPYNPHVGNTHIHISKYLHSLLILYEDVILFSSEEGLACDVIPTSDEKINIFWGAKGLELILFLALRYTDFPFLPQ